MLASGPGGQGTKHLLLSVLLLTAWEAESGQVHYSVPEEAKHGTFVGRIAQDLGLELAELVPRFFRVASKGNGDLLEVNLQNGILFVNSRIDREELCGRSAECSIHLEVIVDRPLQVFHVEVEVKDINDNPPVFPATQKKLFISETRALDSHFSLEGASDADIGANALLTYKLSPSEYFSLEVPTNDDQVKPLQLVLKKLLDREVASEILLVLQAIDGGKPELTGSTELHITVLDVNDNPPVFDKAVHRVKLLENSRNGTLVIRLNASDLDEGSNSHILYSFATDVSSNTEAFFCIDSASGEIKVNGKIDFEETKLWKLQIEAVDKGNPPMFGHCTILVEILDINDNAPELLVTSLSLSVPEDAPPGTVIALISVTDRDSGANGQVTCSLTPRVPFKLVSTFKNYYSLVLDSALDRESVSDYALVVTARDAGSPSLSATSSISMQVKDINDNPPVFSLREQKLLISESKQPDSHFPLEGASDADIGENALLTYRLSQNEYFSLELPTHSKQTKRLSLTLKKYLDREKTPELNLLLTAADGGKPELTGTLQLFVQVLDINDNDPEFEQKEYKVRLMENAAKETFVIKLNATDRDEGVNGEVTYSLMSIKPNGKLLFTLDENNGEVRVNGTLDYEENKFYEIEVQATDKGNPPMAGHCTVWVDILDANDNAPEVTVTSLSLPVREDTQPSTVIALISVSDRDSGANGQRRQRVCSGEGPPKTDLMAFSPSLPPCLDREVGGKMQEAGSNHPGQCPGKWRNQKEPPDLSCTYIISHMMSLYTQKVKRKNFVSAPRVHPLAE
ncbi:PREDICTED: protocadherin alpha-10 [Odobenus rosmarus divergens]|uniref:Protocadherin alpha-10 n=1 Tax=Odobenus rosmarus divergens TaxID=9708 RepID=A0A2U3VRP4_ODORO|nr:PREDICTED: protocadherin alpha-10 [Odobenus rosmarus divergens]